MDVREQSFVEWVRVTQVNSNSLSHRCSSLEDLADGVILFELMSRM